MNLFHREQFPTIIGVPNAQTFIANARTAPALVLAMTWTRSASSLRCLQHPRWTTGVTCNEHDMYFTEWFRSSSLWVFFQRRQYRLHTECGQECGGTGAGGKGRAYKRCTLTSRLR